MRKRTDLEIHITDILIAIDYLLKCTDEDHPAKVIDICRYAKEEYGLIYNGETNTTGNEVDRTRFKNALDFLMELASGTHGDAFPFLLESVSTRKGVKYYIEKHYFTEDEIASIIAAIKNDKYTKDIDTEYFTNCILDLLANKFNKDSIRDRVKELTRGVRKYSSETDRKLSLVTKAFIEKKLIKIRHKIYVDKVTAHIYDFWYRVYQIMEYKGKPYALLIPVNTGNLIFYKNYEFDTIENLKIPHGSIRELLMEDEKDRDLDKLFRDTAYGNYQQYDSLEEMIRANKIPIGGIDLKVSFYFVPAFLKFIVPSFEEFFSTKLDYVACSSFDLEEIGDITRTNEKYYIVPHPVQENEKTNYYVVNININKAAFISWLLSDVHGDGKVCFADIIHIVGPSNIYKFLYYYYLKHAEQIRDQLSNEDADRVEGIVNKNKVH